MRVIGHGGLLRSFFLCCPIRGSGQVYAQQCQCNEGRQNAISATNVVTCAGAALNALIAVRIHTILQFALRGEQIGLALAITLTLLLLLRLMRVLR